MTRKDFELIAGVLARCEARCEDRGESTDAVEFIQTHLAIAIRREHPRFEAGRFEVAALPRKNERLKRAILQDLGRVCSGCSNPYCDDCGS